MKRNPYTYTYLNCTFAFLNNGFVFFQLAADFQRHGFGSLSIVRGLVGEGGVPQHLLHFMDGKFLPDKN